MSFCTVDEAFNNSLKKQIEEHEQNRINNKKHLINSVENNYESLEAPKHVDYRKLNKSYFDTQGDLNGTKISDLKNNINDNYSLGSLADSQSYFSDDSSLLDDSLSLATLPTNITGSTIDTYNSAIQDRSHEYYIRLFLNSITGINDNNLSKSAYKDAHEHVKTCKFCKDEIKLRLGDNNIDIDEASIQNNKYINDDDMKKVIIVIFGGILLIFIIDFFVKINKHLYSRH